MGNKAFQNALFPNENKGLRYICGEQLFNAIFKMGSGISVTSRKVEKCLFEGIWKKN